MKYSADEQAWFTPRCEDHPFEILISGTAQSPDSKRLTQVNKIVDQWSKYLFTVTSYLDTFIDTQKIAKDNQCDSQWVLETIQSIEPDENDLVTFLFSLSGDTYGLWSVRTIPTTFIDFISFSRQQS